MVSDLVEDLKDEGVIDESAADKALDGQEEAEVKEKTEDQDAAKEET